MESAPAVTARALSAGARMLWGWGPLTCTAWGSTLAGVCLLSHGRLASAHPGGSAGSWTVSPGAWTPGPALLELAPDCTVPSTWSLSPSRLRDAPRASRHVLQPFRELGSKLWYALHRMKFSISVPGSLSASPPSWMLLQLPVSAFRSWKIGEALALPHRAFQSWGHSSRHLSQAPPGVPPSWRPFISLFLYFFFSHLPTLIEA